MSLISQLEHLKRCHSRHLLPIIHTPGHSANPLSIETISGRRDCFSSHLHIHHAFFPQIDLNCESTRVGSADLRWIWAVPTWSNPDRPGITARHNDFIIFRDEGTDVFPAIGSKGVEPDD